MASCLELGLITGATRPKPTELEKFWEMNTTQRLPESALFNSNKILYVSTIDEKPDYPYGEGFISKRAFDLLTVGNGQIAHRQYAD